MGLSVVHRKSVVSILLTASLIGCVASQGVTAPTVTSLSYPNTPTTRPAALQPTSTSEWINYAFPDSIDPTKRYLFYLHGKIIEEQVIPAISPDYGEYEYSRILEVLERNGFVVISEPRPKDTDSVEYAHKLAAQIAALINAGIPENEITIVGASKGAGIAIYVSHFLENQALNFVLMGICHPEVVKGLIQDQISLYGNILSIYDSSDEFAGSCQGLFSYSEGPGLSRTHEVVLNVGSGHGILYQPLDEWVIPAVRWADHSFP